MLIARERVLVEEAEVKVMRVLIEAAEDSSLLRVVDGLLVRRDVVRPITVSDDFDATKNDAVTLAVIESASPLVRGISKQQEKTNSKCKKARAIMVRMQSSRPVDARLHNKWAGRYHAVETF